MMTIRKLINRLSAPDPDTARRLQLRAFGKLPSSSEFVELHAGEGPAKACQDWITSGHGHWVTCTEPEKRGRIVSSGLFGMLPEFKNHCFVARMWDSQDNTSRAFPFTLYVLEEKPNGRSWLQHLAVCQQLWRQLDQHFEPLYTLQAGLQDMPSYAEALSANEIVAQAEKTAKPAQRIQLSAWLDAILPATRCGDRIQFIRLLHSFLESWRREERQKNLGIRLPVTPSFPVIAQVAAWLQWLDVNLGPNLPAMTGLFVPQESSQAAAMTVMTRPLLEADFCLLTTNAADYHQVDDPAEAAADVAEGTLPQEAAKMADDAAATLWEWASCRL